MDRKYSQTLLSERRDLRTRRPPGAEPFSPFPGAAPSLSLKISSFDLSSKPAPLHSHLAYFMQHSCQCSSPSRSPSSSNNHQLTTVSVSLQANSHLKVPYQATSCFSYNGVTALGWRRVMQYRGMQKIL